MPSNRAQAAVARLARLWARERETTRAQLIQERAELSLAERVRQGLALSRLSVQDEDAAPGGLSLLWLAPASPKAIERLRLGTGSPVLLWRDAPNEEGALRGTIARRRRGTLGVMVRGELPERLAEASFHLDRDGPEETFDRGDRALAALLAPPERSQRVDPGRLRALLFGKQVPHFTAPPEWTPFDAELNPPQRAAVSRALAAGDLALVHGPPGTGKTRTLVEIIRQAVARGERVLATAASNAAVDNLAERLAAADVELVRLGHPARVSPAVEPHLLSALVQRSEAASLARDWLSEAHARRTQLEKRRSRGALGYDERRAEQQEINRLFRDARQQMRRAHHGILAAAPVVCATCAGADVELLGNELFDLAVVDEATQSPDPITLVALLRAPKAVLAGDPCQLPPTVIDSQAEREGLGTTIFERLAPDPSHAEDSELLTLLTVQHRMHATIMAFPSATHYAGRLEAAPAVAAHTLEELPGVQPDPLRPGPLVFVDTAGTGWEEERVPGDPSTRNPQQAERSAREVRRLLSRGIDPGQVALITPYEAQARLLRELLAAERERGLEVGTVDGFQGREKEAIVVDLVRCNEKGALGFLQDTRRMNVALTRARRFLLVIGDSATLGDHTYYGGFLQAVEEAGGYVSVWGDEAEPL